MSAPARTVAADAAPADVAAILRDYGSAQMFHRDEWSFDHHRFPTGFEAEVATLRPRPRRPGN